MKNVLFECQLSMHILRGSTNFQTIFILHKTFTCNWSNRSRYLLPVISNKVGISDTVSSIDTAFRRQCPHCCATKRTRIKSILCYHLIKVLIPRRKQWVCLSICHLFPFIVFFNLISILKNKKYMLMNLLFHMCVCMLPHTCTHA